MLGIGAFAEKTLVDEGQCMRVDADADPAVVGLMGCGVIAGFAGAVNTGGVSRSDAAIAGGTYPYCQRRRGRRCGGYPETHQRLRCRRCD